MLGYELLAAEGSNGASLVIIATGLVFAVSLLQWYFHGMGGYDDTTNWNSMPVLTWKQQTGKWVLVLSYGRYADYVNDTSFTYKWIQSEGEMGFVQDDPPAECTVFCSPGMRVAVDEIIKNTPQEYYN